jgi:PAS domain S-box-containing protein
MSFSLRGIAWTAFAAAVALIVGCSVYLVRATSQLSASDSLVGHTLGVQAAVENLGGEVFQASNSAEAYILTGDQTLLAGYNTAGEEMPRELGTLRSLTSDNPERAQQLDSVQKDIADQMALLAQSIESHQKGVSNIDADAQMARQIAELQARVEAQFQEIRDDENRLLNTRQAVSRSDYRRTLRWIVISFALALMLLGLQMFLLNYSDNQYRMTEEAAKQSREIVNAFFSSSTVGFGILDARLRYTRVNDVLPRMAGLTPQDLLGKSVPEIFGPRGARTEAVLRGVLKGGVPLLDREVSGELPTLPGEVRHWLVNYFPIPGRMGEFTQMGVIAVDVTARRNAEDALRKLSGRLLGIQDQERRRIARELHDSLGQYLAGLKIALQMLGNASSQEKKEALSAECLDILDKSIAETRTLSHLLHPPLLDEAGFASAAGWYVTGFSQRSGIPVSLDLPDHLPRLSDAVEIALFRVLQESLTNVHRHAQARSAEIHVDLDAEDVSIEISDQGRGLPEDVLEQLRGGGAKIGVGLAGMRERIRELGGRFEVTSGATGTTIRAMVPLSLREADAGAVQQPDSNFPGMNPPTL